MLATCSSLRNAQMAVEKLSSFHEEVFLDLEAKLLQLQIKDKAKLVLETAPVWEALYDEHPSNEVIIRQLVSSLVKRNRVEDARELMDRHYPAHAEGRQILLIRAAMLERIGAYDESYTLYQELIAAEPEDVRARTHFATRIAKRGRFADAIEMMDPIADSLTLGTDKELLLDEWRQKVSCLRRLAPDRDLRGLDCRLLSLECLMEKYANREVRTPSKKQRIALVTGGLGAGGAERQLSRLASLLKSEYDGLDTVSVVVKTLLQNEIKPNDFFLPNLEADKIDVVEIEAMKPVPASRQIELDEDCQILYSMLPPQIHYGVTRLAPYYRDEKIDVASVWQDGATLYGALAALFAGVPKIHLVFRGLPPSVRTERERPEYEIMFRAMAKMPGVTLICNSKLVAVEYARWLDLPDDEVKVLYNAVTHCEAAVAPEDEQKWLDFSRKTENATATLGGVFRLEPLKQPGLWVKFAGEYHSRFPDTRFILLGDGRLRELLEEQIEQLGLTNNFLLVGRTRSVGFWYEKMDVKVLLSQFEGLPNVLIEAQAAGLPVIATPTGGSSECFIEGETGYILDDVEKPDMSAACEKVRELATRFQSDPTASNMARGFVGERFSDEQSLRTFIQLCEA